MWPNLRARQPSPHVAFQTCEPFVNAGRVVAVQAVQHAEAVPVLEVFHADLASLWAAVPLRVC